MAKSKPTNGQIKTTAELRTVLLETIQAVRSGDVDHKQAAAVANLSKAVLASAKLDFEVVRFHETMSDSSSATAKLEAIELSK